MRRKRREFGAPCLFEDRNVGDAKDGYVECTPFEDKMFDLRQSQLEKGTQVSILNAMLSGCVFKVLNAINRNSLSSVLSDLLI